MRHGPGPLNTGLAIGQGTDTKDDTRLILTSPDQLPIWRDDTHCGHGDVCCIDVGEASAEKRSNWWLRGWLNALPVVASGHKEQCIRDVIDQRCAFTMPKEIVV